MDPIKNSEYSAIAKEISALSLTEKTRQGPPRFAEFSEYLNKHPRALLEMAAILEGQSGGLTEERLAGLCHWATEMEMNNVRLVRGEDHGQINITYRLGDLTYFVRPQLGGHYVPTDFTVAMETVEEVRAAEAIWAITGPSAPVVCVEFQGQVEDASGSVYPSEDGGPFTWDGTADFLDLPFDARNESCEDDSYESDTLRDSDRAPAEASDWDGPYCISVWLHEPSERLLALREAAALALNTSPARAAPRGLRI